MSFRNEDSEILAATNTTRCLCSWDSKTGRPLRDPVHLPVDPEDEDPDGDHPYSLCSFALTQDMEHILTGSEAHEKKVVQWDITTGKRVNQSYRGHKNLISAIAVSPNGNHVVSASWDQAIHIWDLSTGEPVCKPLIGTNWFTSVAYSPSGQYLVSSSADRSIIVWDALSGDVQCGPQFAHNAWTDVVRFSPDGKRIASGSNDGNVVCTLGCSGHGLRQTTIIFKSPLHTLTRIRVENRREQWYIQELQRHPELVIVYDVVNCMW